VDSETRLQEDLNALSLRQHSDASAMKENIPNLCTAFKKTTAGFCCHPANQTLHGSAMQWGLWVSGVGPVTRKNGRSYVQAYNHYIFISDV